MAEVQERGVAILEAGVGGDATWRVERTDLPGVIDLLAVRETTHGRFEETAAVAQKTKAIWHDTPNWEKLDPDMKEAFDMMLSKAARILCGNFRCRDHWVDIGKYPELVARRLQD